MTISCGVGLRSTSSLLRSRGLGHSSSESAGWRDQAGVIGPEKSLRHGDKLAGVRVVMDVTGGWPALPSAHKSRVNKRAPGVSPAIARAVSVRGIFIGPGPA
jgi:hypothetical protein